MLERHKKLHSGTSASNTNRINTCSRSVITSCYYMSPNSTILLEKPNRSSVVNKFPKLYRTQRFIHKCVHKSWTPVPILSQTISVHKSWTPVPILSQTIPFHKSWTPVPILSQTIPVHILNYK